MFVQYILNYPDNEKLIRNFRDFVMRARKTEQANFAILALEKIKENFNKEENYSSISYAAEKINNENYEFSLKLLENFKDFRVVSDILPHSDEKTIPYLQEIIKNPYSNQFEQLFKKDSYGLLTDSRCKLEILQSLKNQTNYNDNDISKIISSVKFENHYIAQLLINENMHDLTPTELLLRANSFFALALTDEQKQELAKPKPIKRPRIKEVCEMYEL